MDSSLIISAMVGGVAGEIAKNSYQWLLEIIHAQSPEMQAIAKKNLENFVVHLHERVTRLEQEISSEQSEVFKVAMNHPSTALLVKDAVKKSSVTDNEDRHELLAELIAQRLISNADDMIALAGAAACSIIDCLSSRQIRILAILSTIRDVRPKQKLPSFPPIGLIWWQNSIMPLVKDGIFNMATQLDYEHLAALGCIRISIGSTDLLSLLNNEMFESELKIEESLLADHEWYKSLKTQWDSLGHCMTTSTGKLIGILHKDAKSKTYTQINW